MGYYINPRDMTKEEWLDTKAIEVPNPPPVYKVTSDKGEMVVVCLVDNGAFTGAGVCYSQQELEYFMMPDGRPKRWFIVLITDLEQIPGFEEGGIVQ